MKTSVYQEIESYRLECMKDSANDKWNVSEPLYSADKEANILDGTKDTEPSFFQEYKYKLENIYDKFHTSRGQQIAKERQQIAKERQQSAISFYNNMLKEVKDCYSYGKSELATVLDHSDK